LIIKFLFLSFAQLVKVKKNIAIIKYMYLFINKI